MQQTGTYYRITNSGKHDEKRKKTGCVGDKKWADNLMEVQRATYFYQGKSISDDASRYNMQTFIFQNLALSH